LSYLKTKKKNPRLWGYKTILRYMGGASSFGRVDNGWYR
jgi:hypothetical protein